MISKYIVSLIVFYFLVPSVSLAQTLSFTGSGYDQVEERSLDFALNNALTKASHHFGISIKTFSESNKSLSINNRDTDYTKNYNKSTSTTSSATLFYDVVSERCRYRDNAVQCVVTINLSKNITAAHVRDRIVTSIPNRGVKSVVCPKDVYIAACDNFGQHQNGNINVLLEFRSKFESFNSTCHSDHLGDVIFFDGNCSGIITSDVYFTYLESSGPSVKTHFKSSSCEFNGTDFLFKNGVPIIHDGVGCGNLANQIVQEAQEYLR